MKVLICGSRDWAEWEPIQSALEQLPSNTTIIHGEAPGADSIAHRFASEMGFRICRYPANWKKYGRGAGPIRNQEMIDKEKPDLVIAFHKGASRGTQDTINRAQKAGIPVKIIVAN